MHLITGIVSKTFSVRKLALVISLTLLSLFMIGCAAPTYNVTLEMAPTYHSPNGVYPSVEVDIVAVNDDEAIRIIAYSTDTYFQPDNKFRKNLDKHTIFFSEEDFKNQTFKSDDPLWTKWNNKGVTTLFVIANLPGIWEVKTGKLDPRRLKLPLASKRWPDGNTIKVQMQSSGLSLQTPLTPIAADK